MRKISIIIPVCNEDQNLGPLYEQLCQMGQTLPSSFQMEIVFVDDFSTDNSRALLEELAQSDRRVKVICLARNFGSHSAIKAGLQYVSGEYIAMISADLQDPPEIIPQLLNKALDGYDVVWGYRESRDDPTSKILFAKLFYRIINRISDIKVPESGMDVVLISKRVKDIVKRMKEINTFLHFQILWLGYRQAFVPYQRRPRRAGKTKWSFIRRLDSAISALTSFSYLPIRFISYIGISLFLLSFFYAIILLLNYMLGHPAGGFTTTMLVIITLFGIMFLCLGILAEYLWRALWQVMGRPEYLIDRITGQDLPNQECNCQDE